MTKAIDLIDDLKQAIHVRNGASTRVNTPENKQNWDLRCAQVIILKEKLKRQIDAEELD